MKQLTPYQKRQRAGRADRAKYLKHRNKFEHYALLFAGFAVGSFFVLVMGFFRRYESPTEILFAFTLTGFVGLMLFIRQYFLVRASWAWWKIKGY